MPKATGSPRIIVVAGAALRVADLCRCVAPSRLSSESQNSPARTCRDVKSFKTKTKDGLIDVAKLFAKVRRPRIVLPRCKPLTPCAPAALQAV